VARADATQGDGLTFAQVCSSEGTHRLVEAGPCHRFPLRAVALVTAPQLARVQKRCRTRADGMEIFWYGDLPPCGAQQRNAACSESAERCNVSAMSGAGSRIRSLAGLLLYGVGRDGLNHRPHPYQVVSGDSVACRDRHCVASSFGVA